MKEWVKFALLAVAFLVFYFAPIDAPIVLRSLGAGLTLLHEYARLHVLTCLVPAFFIAGTIAVYVKKDAVLRLLGPATKKSSPTPSRASPEASWPSAPARSFRSSPGFTSGARGSGRPSHFSSPGRPSTSRRSS